jgi:squalene-associated FAD-dependent desaturase
MGCIYIIGAGLSGLSCAVQLASRERKVKLFEATGHAGGRCRSFFDEKLGCTIDNGNHLLLSANLEARSYINTIGANNEIEEISPAKFDFIEPDLSLQWSIKPGPSYFPLASLFPKSPVPGTTWRDYKEFFYLYRSSREDTVGNLVNQNSKMFERLWQPLCKAVLNTNANDSSAYLLRKFMALTLMRGENSCRPIIFKEGLSDTLVQPALKYLAKNGIKPAFNSPAQKMEINGSYAKAVHFPKFILTLGKDDLVVLALPPRACHKLYSAFELPTDYRCIINVHFRIEYERSEIPAANFIGSIRTISQWIFFKKNIVSVTVSDAEELSKMENTQIAELIWKEVTKICDFEEKNIPPWRVIKERHATIAQTPQTLKTRPNSGTQIKNLFIAGDWTNTDLPATIESSIFSGRKVASLICDQHFKS